VVLHLLVHGVLADLLVVQGRKCNRHGAVPPDQCDVVVGHSPNRAIAIPGGKYVT
jgi:hypothetical protein